MHGEISVRLNPNDRNWTGVHRQSRPVVTQARRRQRQQVTSGHQRLLIQTARQTSRVLAPAHQTSRVLAPAYRVSEVLAPAHRVSQVITLAPQDTWVLHKVIAVVVRQLMTKDKVMVTTQHLHTHKVHTSCSHSFGTHVTFQRTIILRSDLICR